MKILEVTLTNWMNITQASLSFNEGINVLYGQNGQGKSAVLSAIAFMLLEKTRDSSYKNFIQIGKDSFTVTMKIDMGTDDIMSFSYIGSSGSCAKDIAYQGAHYINSDASTFIASKFDKEMLENVIFFLQDSSSITSLTPAERRDIFKKIFNSDYSYVVDKIKADQKLLDQRIIQLTTEIDLLANKKYSLFRIVDVDLEELEKLRIEFADSQNSALDKEKYKAYSEKLKDLNTSQQELAQASEAKTKLLLGIDTNKASMDAVDATVNELTLHKEVLENSLTTLQQEVEVQKQVCTEHTLSLDTLEVSAKIEVKNKEFVNASATLQINTRYLDTHRKGLCDSCGQACDPKNLKMYEELVTQNQDNLENLSLSITTINKELQAYRQTMTANDALLTAKTKAVETAKMEVEKIAGAITAKKSNKEMYQQLAVSYAERLQELQNNINSLVLKTITLNDWVTANKVEVKENSSRTSTQIQADIDEITMQIQENATHAKINAQSQIERQADTAHSSELTVELNNVQKQSKELATVISVFTTDFPAFINMRACQVLESYLNDFFANTKKGFKISLQQDKKGINFYYKAGNEPQWNSIKMTSGFEASLVTLAFRVAVAYAFGSDIIVLDEPDGTGDPEHSNRLFETISTIGGFKQMFIITHKESAVDLLKDKGALVYEVSKGTFIRSK
jgi:DNA repair exonuclease SbcCD ATPase subunit